MPPHPLLPSLLPDDIAMTAAPHDPRFDALSRSVFAALPEPELARLAGEVHESRLRAGHLLYAPEVTVIASGLNRAFLADDTGRQVTVTYLRSGATLGLAYLAGRHYPTAFQAIEDKPARRDRQRLCPPAPPDPRCVRLGHHSRASQSAR